MQQIKTAKDRFYAQAIGLILVCSIYGGQCHAQTYSIDGPTTTTVGQSNSYGFIDSSFNPPGNGYSYTWITDASGTISESGSSYYYAIDDPHIFVSWGTTGIKSIDVDVEDIVFFVDYFQDDISVTISNPTPAIPSNPTVQSTNCGNTILQRSTPPNDVTWFWQSSASGTSTSNSSSTITLTSGSTYYLRARSSDNVWSLSSSSVNYTVNAVPSTPTAPTIVNSCGSTTLTMGSAPNGITWYWQTSSTGTSTGSYNSGTSITPPGGTSVYYLRARNDTNGCWSAARTVNYTIDIIPDQPTLSSITHPTCSNATGSFTITNYNGSYTYSVSPSTGVTVTGSTITAPAGNYTVTATLNGCTSVASATTTVNAQPITPGQPTLSSVTHPTCSNALGSFTITNYNGSYTYSVSPSTGVTVLGSTITAPTGNYAVTASSNGCTSVVSTTRTVNAQPSTPISPSITKIDPTCAIGTGSISVTAPIGGGNEYSFDDGATYQTAVNKTGLSAGSYIVRVKNTLGCVSSGTTVTISSAPSTPDVPSVSVSDPSCLGGLGTITITAPIASGNEYSFDDGANYQTGAVKTDLNPGSYTIKVRNASGCVSAGTTVTVAALPTGAPVPTIGSIVNPSCKDQDGSFTITNYNSSYTYNFTPSNSSIVVSNTGVVTAPPNIYRLTTVLGECASGPSIAVNIIGSNHDCGQQLSGDPQLHNYIYSRSYQTETENAPVFFNANGDIVQQIGYYDGLGRPFQQIGLEQSPEVNNTKPDIVTHMVYDEHGRMKEEWLPVPVTPTSFGNLETDVETSILAHYNTLKYENTTNPYSQKEFEPSPLNRVLKQAAPGEDWKLGNGHEIAFEYLANTAADNVALFEVTTSFADNTYTPTLGKNGTYLEGELYKNVTKDENHTSGNDHSTEEFTNKQGQVILKRTYNAGAAHDTYYVYDDFGNLSYVLPPKMDASTESLTNINAAMDELAYQYVYDQRNRLVEKKIPGKGWEHIVYNKLDQPIMTQDSIQRQMDEWLFTKYDALGRVVYTGKAVDTDDREVVQGEVDALTTDLWVYQNSTSSNFGGVDVYYDNGAYPTGTLTEVLTINYYDDYVNAPTGVPASVVVWGSDPQENNATNVKGLATVSKVKVLTTNDWITTLTYYDKKARPIYTYSENEYLSTVDIVESKLDFLGKPMQVRTSHNKDGNVVATLDNFSYDHVGRLLKQTQCIGDGTLGYTCDGSTLVNDLPLTGTITASRVAPSSITVSPEATLSGDLVLSIDPNATSNGGGSSGAEELIAYNNYDELGQLQAKKVGGIPEIDYASTVGLQTVDYAYNVRGWLKQINDPSNLGSDLFAFGINYNAPTHGATALHNGNISETEWRTSNTDNSLRWYRHAYDPLNRLVSSIDNTTDQRYSLSNLSYDKNGNVLGLTRKGHLNTGGTSFGNMDVLGYVYDSGNKVLRINDSGNDTYGFKNGTNSNDDFEYDPNGNLKIDRNKGINTITYNHLNMPTLVDFGATGNVAMVYAADGTKLKKTTSNGTVTEYANGYVYEGGQLQFFNHPEGYVMPDGNGYRYVYQFKDHVDNVRLSYTDNNGTLEIVEENNYYPFGGKMKGYNTSVSPLGNSTAQRWKFGGMELDNSLNEAMGTYDFGARTYDPWDIRWWNIDPKAELMRRHSPYNYAFNNPVYFTDPDGMMPVNPILRLLRKMGKNGVNFAAKNSKGQLKPISRKHAEKLLSMKKSVFKTTTGGGSKKAKRLMKEVAKDKTVVRHDGHKLKNLQGKETGKKGLAHFQKKAGDGSHVFFDNAKNGTLAVAPAAASSSDASEESSSSESSSGSESNLEDVAAGLFEFSLDVMDFFTEGHDDGSNPEGEIIMAFTKGLLELSGEENVDIDKTFEEARKALEERKRKKENE